MFVDIYQGLLLNLMCMGYFFQLNSLGLVRSHDCHKSHDIVNMKCQNTF